MMKITIESDEKEVAVVNVTYPSHGERMVIVTKDEVDAFPKAQPRGVVLCADDDPWLVALEALRSVTKEKSAVKR